MEFNNFESEVLENTTNEAAQNHALELSDLELAFVGGGNVIVTVG
jgi:hypothetical protein